MMYHLYELQRHALAPARALAWSSSKLLSHPLNPLAQTDLARMGAAALDVFHHSTHPYGKPQFGLDHTIIDGERVAVEEVTEVHRPFGNLVHFSRAAVRNDPRLLIVAPMSGHYATLLRGTVEAMLPDHDVYITDWADAKMVPLWDGAFDLDDYIDYVIAFLEHIGPGTHVMAVCQPSVPSLAATALMNAADHPAAPATLTMMGGPIDTRESPTSVNFNATKRPLAWFEQNVIMTVPAYYPGAFRRVYPGFVQLASFMGMNLGNHMQRHWDWFNHLVEGAGDDAQATRDFYEEYLAVCDLPSEFYLQTVHEVFQNFSLPKGELMHRETRVDAGAIRRTALMAIEGERDDISGLGQTKAALKIATGLDAGRKHYHMAKGAGHYGIFNGKRWRESIAPAVKAFIRKHGG